MWIRKNRIGSAILAVVLVSVFFSVAKAQNVADSSQTEWIKVYFNQPADHSVALPGNESNDRYDLIGTLEALIEQANRSIDLAIYDLEHPRIGRALAKAANEGVRVRVVTDDHNRTDAGNIDENMWSILRNAGIVSIDDDGDIYTASGIKDHELSGSSYDMHHKFAIIDAQTPTPEDDYVWTGSTNVTYTGAYNTNNTVIIKDSGVADAYLAEFNQLWGGSGSSPQPDRARYHKAKEQIENNIHHVGNTKVEVYFGPVKKADADKSISSRIVELMEKEAQNDINFQAFAISPDIPISSKMWALSAEGSIALNGLIDRAFYYRYKSNGEIWASREANVRNRNIQPANELRKLHHKVIIIDGYHPDPADKGVAITGSYNFSKNAEFNNDENLLIIHSDEIANQYFQDFKGAMNRATGEFELPVPKIYVDQTYEPYQIIDGRTLEIELAPGFGYGVRPLGVWVPTIYAGNDSSHYYADQASYYVENLVSNSLISIHGPYKSKPDAYDNRFYGYITLHRGGEKISLNRRLLINGYGLFMDYRAQHPDSVEAFKRYEAIARRNNRGIWQHEGKIRKRIPRSRVVDDSKVSAVSFPLNINTASEEELQHLPGIGPAYSKRIVAYRTKNKGFSSVEELREVKGIGPKTLEKLRPIVTIK